MCQDPPETQGKDSVENKRSLKKSVALVSPCVCVGVDGLSEKQSCYLCYSFVSFVYAAHSLF